MTHGETHPETANTSHFQAIARRVLQGRIPLLSSLSHSEREAAVRDSVAVFFGIHYPGCIGLIECRHGTVKVAMSYNQLYLSLIPSPVNRLLTTQEIIPMCESFLDELRSVVIQGSCDLDELDTDTALTAFRLLTIEKKESLTRAN